LQFQYPSYAGESETFVDQLHDAGDAIDIVAAVTTLVTVGAPGRYEFMRLEAPQESLLDVEHVCDLADREERQAVVGIEAGHVSLVS
jgi:hypothetical protein